MPKFSVEKGDVKRMVNWGVIGAGGIADRRTIPEGILPARNAKLVAVMDVDAQRAEAVAAKYGVNKYYTKEEDLLADDEVQAVYIATPVYLHCHQTVIAAEHKKHVLCEKHMAMSIQEAEDMIKTCKSNGVKLGIGFMMRFHAYHRKLKAMIQAGLLGKIVMGRAQLTCWYPDIPGAWRQVPELGGGGSLADMGSHCIDLLEMFIGKVAELTAFTNTLVHKYPAEDTATVLLRFETGAHGIVDNYFNVPDAASKNVLEIYGTKGSVLAKGTIGQMPSGEMMAYLQPEERSYEALQAREAPEVTEQEIAVTPINMYQAEIENFSECIEKDTEPLVTGEEGLWNLRIILAAYESARSGQRICIK